MAIQYLIVYLFYSSIVQYFFLSVYTFLLFYKVLKLLLAVDVFIFVWIVKLRLIAFAHFEVFIGGQYAIPYCPLRRAIRGWQDYALANQNARTVVAI